MSNSRPTFSQTILKTGLAMVPHWYEAKAGRIRHELTVRSIGDPPIPIRLPYWTTRDFGEVDKDLHSIMSEVAAQVMADMGRRKRADFSRLDLEVFAQSVVLEWLIDRDPSVEWVKLLDYAHMLRERTYENDPVVFNAILDATAERGSIDITSEEEGVQKKIDPLATSLNTLFVLDKTDTRIVSYEQIPLTRDDKRSHFAHPSVLAPITSGLNSGDFSFHRMRRGDVLITDSAGLVVTRRKGQWYVYNIFALHDTIFDLLGLSGPQGVSFAKSLVDVVFDLSYRRHGALLVYDPKDKVREKLSNPETVFGHTPEDTPQRILEDSLNGLSFSDPDRIQAKRHLLLEAASMDGAIIFDDESIRSCGSFIKPADGVPSDAGARTTAAKSALLHGGIPIKVSADGDVSIYFHPEDGSSEIARLHFA